jgi:DNA-binding beta-propeller fold protein YncE
VIARGASRHALLTTLGCGLVAHYASVALAQESPRAPLVLEAKIPLGDSRGRIDHPAVDVLRQRLYVPELGDDRLGVIDLQARITIRTITGLKEPQGVGYVPSTDAVYVANGKSGLVHVYRGTDLTLLARIKLGDDADNVRVDDVSHRVFVGYGSGAIAVIDATTLARVADIPLRAHPESFRLEAGGQRIFVNVPGANEIAVLDRVSNAQVAAWPTRDLHANYPLALEGPPRERVLAIFRHPAQVAAFQATDGRRLADIDTCGDADDAFVDSKRNRLYVICGEGVVDVFDATGSTYARVARLATSPGARTGLFVPELDRLYVAARASSGASASVWVFAPQP